eukprot:GHVH01000967.1.p1 GENE.GHVH01000967.1~~GHVH01000967.1.p1  ORF type:complete len:269 (+),score=26.79 GHVH01000967.1:95-901(+)
MEEKDVKPTYPNATGLNEIVRQKQEPQLVAFDENDDHDSVSTDCSATKAPLLTGASWEAPPNTMIIPSYERSIEEACQDYLRQVEGLDLDNHPEMQTLMDKIEEELEVTLSIFSKIAREHKPRHERREQLKENKLLRSTTFALNRSLMEMVAYDTKIAKLSQALQVTLSQVDVLGELFSRANQGRIEAQHRSSREKTRTLDALAVTKPVEFVRILRCETPKAILSKKSVGAAFPEKGNKMDFLTESQLTRCKNSVATKHLYGSGAALL